MPTESVTLEQNLTEIKYGGKAAENIQKHNIGHFNPTWNIIKRKINL